MRQFNKSLMYYFFYNSKLGILTAVIIMAMLSYLDVNSRLDTVTWRIRELLGNDFSTTELTTIVGLCIIITAIYILITGLNKRNLIIFLSSEPYTKEEVKKNEIYFLIGILLLLVGVFFYVNFCFIIRERDKFSFIFYENRILFFDCIKLILLGIAFILYIEIMDMLFSNTFITIIASILMPISIISIISSLISMEFLLPIQIWDNLDSRVFQIKNYIYNLCAEFLGLRELDSYYLWVKTNIILVAIVIFIIGAILILKALNKRFYIQNMNSIFIFPKMKKIIVSLVSMFLATYLMRTIILIKYERSILNTKFFYSYDVFKGSILYLIIFLGIIIFSIIIRKVISTLLKKIY